MQTRWNTIGSKKNGGAKQKQINSVNENRKDNNTTFVWTRQFVDFTEENS